MNEIWNHSLKGGLGCIAGKEMHLSDYFDCRPLSDNATFWWEGIRFTLAEMPHVTTNGGNHNSFGLLIKEENEEPVVFITTDTQFQLEFISKISKKVSLIFHDCETSPFKSNIHAHYEDLCTLPAEIKQKMWLYHYQPDPHYKPEADGFKGFIKKGQEFYFTSEKNVLIRRRNISRMGLAAMIRAN